VSAFGSGHDPRHPSNMFLDMSPEAREIKAKINYRDYIEMKFLHSKGNNQQN